MRRKAFGSVVAALILLLAFSRPCAAQRATPEKPSAEALGESVQQLLSSLWAPQSRYTNSPHLRRAFRPVAVEPRAATVEVRSTDRKRRVAYGVLVGPDGWVVTKASQVRGAVSCRLADGREFEATLVGIDPPWDLAMLKIGASGLPAIKLEATPTQVATQSVALRTGDASTGTRLSPPQLRPGDWLATIGLGRDPVAVGVVSVELRAIPKQPGFLGVQLDLHYTSAADAPAGVRVEAVTPEGAALEAGLQAGDLILEIDGAVTPTPEALKSAIAEHHPGDRIEVGLLRGEERVTVVAVLRGWAPNPAERRAHYQNRLGGELSERRFGFPLVLQHDTVLAPDECGGPVVDLEGRVIGINIARAGRTESYALPIEEVRSRLLDLMSGRLAPVGSVK